MEAHDTTTSDVIAAVKEALAAGINVIPPCEDGSKAPIAPNARWATYQERKATKDELNSWYGNGHKRHGLGGVCGPISGNLEVMEFDAAGEVYQTFKEGAASLGLGPLIARIEAGYCEESPSGGVHWPWRCSEISGSTKLARRPKRPEEQKHADDMVQVLIETKATGGFIILAPSFGPVHPSGKPYRRVSGSFATIAHITPEERKAILDLARTFDQMPEKVREQAITKPPAPAGSRPGDDFNAKATWEEVLEPHGWKRAYDYRGVVRWTRPGKDAGVSATTNWMDSDLLYVFSTATVFEAERSYDKFGAYAALNHGGDPAAAARELASKGFGTPEVLPQRPAALDAKTLSGPSIWHGLAVFEKKDFLPSNAARNLMQTGLHIAKGGSELYIYRNGVYVPGEEHVKSLLAQDMGQDWRGGRADAVLRFLYDVAPELLEAPPLGVVNLANGILRLDTGNLEPHTPALLSRVQLPVEYNPEAECPAICRFFEEVLPADCFRLPFEIAGLLTLPDRRFQKAFMLVGDGENGKGVILGLFTALLGKVNVSSRTLQDLSENRFATADLYGKLANIAGDIPGRGIEDSAMFKALTGGDAIAAERKMRDPFAFINFARLIFSANEIPASGDATHAYRRRWTVLRLHHRFDGKPCPALGCGRNHERDRDLLEKLTTKEELSGFLNMALLAYTEVVERGGFQVSASLLAGEKELEVAIDPVATFMAEKLDLQPEAQTGMVGLYAAYREWAVQAGSQPLGRRKFNDRLRNRGFHTKIVHGKDYWAGFAVRAEG